MGQVVVNILDTETKASDRVSIDTPKSGYVFARIRAYLKCVANGTFPTSNADMDESLAKEQADKLEFLESKIELARKELENQQAVIAKSYLDHKNNLSLYRSEAAAAQVEAVKIIMSAKIEANRIITDASNTDLAIATIENAQLKTNNKALQEQNAELVNNCQDYQQQIRQIGRVRGQVVINMPGSANNAQMPQEPNTTPEENTVIKQDSASIIPSYSKDTGLDID